MKRIQQKAAVALLAFSLITGQNYALSNPSGTQPGETPKFFTTISKSIENNKSMKEQIVALSQFAPESYRAAIKKALKNIKDEQPAQLIALENGFVLKAGNKETSIIFVNPMAGSFKVNGYSIFLTPNEKFESLLNRMTQILHNKSAAKQMLFIDPAQAYVPGIFELLGTAALLTGLIYTTANLYFFLACGALGVGTYVTSLLETAAIKCMAAYLDSMGKINYNLINFEGSLAAAKPQCFSDGNIGIPLKGGQQLVLRREKDDDFRNFEMEIPVPKNQQNIGAIRIIFKNGKPNAVALFRNGKLENYSAEELKKKAEDLNLKLNTQLDKEIFNDKAFYEMFDIFQQAKSCCVAGPNSSTCDDYVRQVVGLVRGPKPGNLISPKAPEQKPDPLIIQ